jgi:hypothetical protein
MLKKVRKIVGLVIGKTREEVENQINRRSFFNKAGKASLVIAALSMLPLKLFDNKKTFRRKIKVRIHPSAVKRNDKGLK